MTSGSLDGRVAVVTGAVEGIGWARPNRSHAEAPT